MSWKHDQNLTTHVFLLLDRSVSMEHLAEKVRQVTRELVADMASKSEAAKQDWRVSLLTFGSDVSLHTWDMDVLRFQSMMQETKFYEIDGNTALIDAMNTALDDAEKITQHRGDHSFLFHLVTDGEENWSVGKTQRGYSGHPGYGVTEQLTRDLTARLKALPDNYTLAVYAPDKQGVQASRDLGFENIWLWDATSEAGMEAMAQAMKNSSSTYMEARTKGAAGLRTMTRGGLFVGGNVDAAAVKAANLKPLPTEKRKIVVVVKTEDSFEKVRLPANSKRAKPVMGWFVKIEDYVKRINKGTYPLGDAFYELVKGETIEGDKEIAVVDVNTNQVFVGAGARQLLGLPAERRRVKPDQNAGYKIFIQSNSLNRHLPHGCSVMVLDR
jgi:hypothetical protein